MGLWKQLTRPKAVGMVINNDTLYAQRYTTHPEYRLLRTPDERRAYLTPIPIPLKGARVFFDARVIGQSTAAVGVPVGPFIPILPVSLGKKKVFWVSVYTDANVVYEAWSASGKQALRLYRKAGKLIAAANKAPAPAS